jgi:hypothetical protein
MAKSKQSFVNDPAQLSLFDSIKRDQEERTAKRPGRMCVSARLNAAVKTAIKNAAKSREQITRRLKQPRPLLRDYAENWPVLIQNFQH